MVQVRMIAVAILLLLIPFRVTMAQDGVRIHSHKFYDTKRSDNPKYLRRNLMADIDSTGITLKAWGAETFLKMNLLQKMAISRTFFRKSLVNGQPAVMFGSNAKRFRIFVNKSGNLEFDGLILKRPASGRYSFRFSIQTKGLSFHKQGPLIQEEINAFAERPDSVLNSYAVYRNSRLNGVAYNPEEVGKFTQIYRPRAWDSSVPPDTVWGFIDISPSTGTMMVGVDDVWGSNATLPIIIDPQFGVRDVGSSSFAPTADRIYVILDSSKATLNNTNAANIDSAQVHSYVTIADKDEKIRVFAWDSNDGDITNDACASIDLAYSSDSTAVNNTSAQWNTLVMSGSLSSGIDYATGVVGSQSTSTRLRVSYDFVSNSVKYTSATALAPPATMTGCVNTWALVSAKIFYTEGGGGSEPSKRRRIVLKRAS